MPKHYGKDKKVPKGSHKMPDGSIMKDSDMPKKKSGGSKKPKTAWMTHLDKVYKDGKKKKADYKYSDAMKDAKKSYKK